MAQESCTENFTYADLRVGVDYETKDPRLLFLNGRLMITQQKGVNETPEFVDVTEQVANEIAKYIKES